MKRLEIFLTIFFVIMVIVYACVVISKTYCGMSNDFAIIDNIKIESVEQRTNFLTIKFSGTPWQMILCGDPDCSRTYAYLADSVIQVRGLTAIKYDDVLMKEEIIVLIRSSHRGGVR